MIALLVSLMAAAGPDLEQLQDAAAAGSATIRACREAPEPCDGAKLGQAFYAVALRSWVVDLTLAPEEAAAVRALDPGRFELLPEPVRGAATHPPAWMNPREVSAPIVLAASAPLEESPSPVVEPASAPENPVNDAAVLAAVELYKKGKYHEGAIAFTALTAAEPQPRNAQVQYFVGKCLEPLGYPDAAFQEYMRAANDERYGKYATSAALRIQQNHGDIGPLEARLGDVLTPYPGPARNGLNFLEGRAAARRGDVTGALTALDVVSPKTTLYPRARLLEAGVHLRNEKFKSAVMAYRDAVHTGSGWVSDSALLGVGRIYYSLKQFDRAVTYYDLVPRKSAQYGQAMVEAAWADIHLNKPARASSRLRSLRRDSWVPEAGLVRALAELQAENEAGGKAIASEALVVAQADRHAIDAVLDMNAADLIHAFEDQGLPRGLDERLRADLDLAAMLGHTASLRKQQARLAGSKIPEPLRTRIDGSLVGSSAELQARFSRSLRVELEQERAQLDFAATQLQAIQEDRLIHLREEFPPNG